MPGVGLGFEDVSVLAPFIRRGLAAFYAPNSGSIHHAPKRLV
jgi:hypothetical protein